MKRFLAAVVVTSVAPALAAQPSGEGGNDERNLLLAFSQMAGMQVCDQMRDRFRTLEGDGEHDAAAGTLWIESCTASAEGTRLSMALGGRGWRWIYESKEEAAAEFKVSQYATFAVDVQLQGDIDAAYDPEAEVFSFWFQPVGEPAVRFRPLGDVEVNSDGLWSSVVGGAASIFSASPDERAREELRSQGRENFKEQFGRGFRATLDFCTGELETGFGSGEDALDEEPGDGEGTAAFMHGDGLILDGPHAVNPKRFAVRLESDGPLRAELMCLDEAKRLAEAFVAQEPLPEVEALEHESVHGRTALRIEASYVGCPVVLALRPESSSPEQVFAFRYHIASEPLIQPAQHCRR